MGWNYLSIPKIQQLHRWSVGMGKWFHSILYNRYHYLSMLVKGATEIRIAFPCHHVIMREHNRQITISINVTIVERDKPCCFRWEYAHTFCPQFTFQWNSKVWKPDERKNGVYQCYIYVTINSVIIYLFIYWDNALSQSSWFACVGDSKLMCK